MILLDLNFISKPFRSRADSIVEGLGLDIVNPFELG
jgi:hypothetical protein